ncbi:hypothetical protein GOP47_0019745 [Adiantum capillus-veneris]|uniref:C3H1-type domain-containing protein n=1 Tax=Adiantum capillus-veneris TaxID=13818 RepID=A0A9D4Z8R9_ADICA|nr:hypothetical protein GOP47_0019745 [Adiantum capillus-veneris]
MDDEAQKRNTDCVYFLASPLTCKKGNNCEFRHSEAARMNPRDCWYWIHSTCRNPNCSFRHPPLEGKQTSSVPPQSAPTAPVVPTTAMPAAALASKSKTPCYFFSQGNCVKGDKCPFMHGPALSTSVDTANQQKPPSKALQSEATQAINKPVVVLQSVASNVTKATPPENLERRSLGQNDFRPVSSKAPAVFAQEKPQTTAKDSERAKVLGSSVTTNPYRMETLSAGRKSRVTLFSDTPDEYLNSTEGPHDIHGPADSRQGHPGRKQQQLSHYEHEHSNSYQGADHRYQNGSKGDTWWKNETSSFDGDGSDQSIQREDGEYSPHLGSRGRPKVLDDTTSRVYKGSQSHGREGFDSVSAQHRQLRHQHYREQKMQHESDQNGTSDHMRQHGFSSGTRISVRDGQRMVSEGPTSSIDLRNHLLKRRRDDRGHHPRNESLSRRGPSEMADTAHLNQRRDDGFNQRDQQGRLPLRGVDHRGVKRLRHDGGASPDGRSSRTSPMRRLGPGRSPDRALSVVSPSRHSGLDHSRSEARERGRDRYASKTALVADVRSHSTTKSMKSEYAKDDAGFAAPKSLAQIKAEKQAELNAGGTQWRDHRGKHLEEPVKLADSRAPISSNHQDSIASTSRLKRSHADSSLTSKRENKSASSEDFEGPKPLSLLLKDKQKAVLGNSVEAGMTALKKSEDGSGDSNREVEDGEVRDEEDVWKDDHSQYADSPNALLQEELAPRSESDPNVEEAPEADHSQGVADAQDDMGSSDEEDRLELGQTLSGDEDYELDDDDDDDFAKKLGGFFS